MKILHIVDYFTDKLNYQENLLSYWQNKLGHEVKIVTSDYYYPFPNYERTMEPVLGNRKVGIGTFMDRNVDILRKKSYSISKKYPSLIWFRVSDVINDFMPDVIHVHGATNLCLIEVLAMKKHYRYKIFVDSHQDYMVQGNHNSLFRKIYNKPWRILYKHSLDKGLISLFLPITENAMEWLNSELSIPMQSQKINPLGVDIEKMYFHENEAKQFRKKHLIGNKILFIYAGKIYEGKRVDWIIDLLSKLRNQEKIFLLLIGNATLKYSDYLTQKLNKVKYEFLRLPFMNHEDLRSAFSAADIGIWPGIPSNAIQEAMACETVVILPNNKIVGHLVSDNGLLENENIERASNFLNDLCENDSDLNKSKKKSSEIVKQYSWEIITKELIDIYKNNS